MIRGSITPELWARSFDNFRTTSGLEIAIEKCQALARGKIQWLMLMGPPGVGKTHLAVATAKLYDSLHIIRVADTLVYDAKIAWWSVPLLLEAEISTWQTGDTSPLLFCRDADLLVLDDLGIEHAVEQFHGRLMALFELRYTKRALTLVTTNLSPADIARRYGERFQSRFLELGDVIKIKAPDYRAVGEPQDLEPEPIVGYIEPDYGDPVSLDEFLENHAKDLNGVGMLFLRRLAEGAGVEAALDQIKKAKARARDPETRKRLDEKERLFLAWIKKNGARENI